MAIITIKFLVSKRWKYIVPVLAIISLLISCIIVSSKKFFWNDELYSYYLLADPSFAHMMGAFHDKINNSPPLYFVLGWLWTRVFSDTELSLRLFSSLGMCIGCTAIWLVLRRTYDFWSASIGTLGVFCVSDIILSQNVEARMYGLLLAVCSVGLLLYKLISEKPQCSIGLISLNTFIHIAIVQTHLFGALYTVAIALSLIVRDKYFKLFRPKIYFSIILSLISIIPYIPSFLNQADAGNPRTWISPPSLRELFPLGIIDFSSLSIFNILFLLVILISIYGLRSLFKINNLLSFRGNSQASQDINGEISLVIVAVVFLLVPVFVWIISRTIKPIFVDRYMIPSTFSWSIIVAHLLSRYKFNAINPERKIFKFLNRKYQLTGLLVIMIILIINPIIYAKNFPREQFPGLNDNKYGYRELPIVVQASAQFIERLYYSPERHKYFFILDWEAAVDKASGLFGPQEYKHLDALKRNYPNLFQNQVVKSEDFLNMYNRFLVLDYADYDKTCPLKVKGEEKARKWEDMHCPRWVEMRLLSNPHYKVTHLGDIYGEAVLLVEKQK